MADPPYQPGQAITEGSFILYRRIPNWLDFYEYDEGRPTTQAFREDADDEYLSMYVASWTTVDEVMAGAPEPRFGLCSLPLSLTTELGLRVTYEPQPGPAGAAHVGVWDITKSKRRKLTLRSKVHFPPTPRS